METSVCGRVLVQERKSENIVPVERKYQEYGKWLQHAL